MERHFVSETLLDSLTPETRAQVEADDLCAVACAALASDVLRSYSDQYVQWLGAGRVAQILAMGGRPLVANFALLEHLGRRGLIPDRVNVSGEDGPPLLSTESANELADKYVRARVAADMGSCESVTREYLGQDRERGGKTAPFATLLFASCEVEAARRACQCDACARKWDVPLRERNRLQRDIFAASKLIPGRHAGATRDVAGRAVEEAVDNSTLGAVERHDLRCILLEQVYRAEEAKPALDSAAASYYAGLYANSREAVRELETLTPRLRAAEQAAKHVAGRRLGRIRELLEEQFATGASGPLYAGMASLSFFVYRDLFNLPR